MKVTFIIFALNAIVNNVYGNFVVEIVENKSRTAKISEQCRLALELYADNLNKSTDDAWAMKMWDASSKVPSGLISYNFGEMGNFKQCVETKSIRDRILGKYCLASIIFTNTSLIHVTLENNNVSLQQQGVSENLTVPLHFPNNSTYIISQIYWRNLISLIATGIGIVGNPTWAICIPSNCSGDDVLTVLRGMQPEFVNFESATCQTEDDVNPQLTTDAIIGISILAMLAAIIILSTSYDLYCDSKNKGTAHPVFITFSLITNGRKLFHMNENSGELSSLNGMRFISMLWIVAVHTYSVNTSGPVFNEKDVIDFINSPSSMIFVSGNLACDTFLLIGGLLVSYVYFKRKRNEESFKFLEHYVHRYIRLTSALAATVLVSATLLSYMGSGPKWYYITNSFENNCKKYWWSTLLYIQNYVNVNQMCVGQSWYLNVDMQLYLFSPLILILFGRYPKSTIGLLASGTLASVIASFWIAYAEQLSGITSNFYPKVPKQTYMDDYYLKTHTRAAPWLMGMILGFFLAKDDVKHGKIPKMLSIIIWICSIVVLITCVFGGHSTLRSPDYDRLGNSCYIALVRSAWAIALGWMIWACANNQGGMVNTFLSHPIFQLMNKFTYSIYLLHVTILYMIEYSQETSLYFSVFNLAYSFGGIFLVSFSLSMIWYLVFESPLLELEKCLWNSRK